MSGIRSAVIVHDTFNNRSAVDRSATSSAFMTASVWNSTSIEPPPVRSVAETPSRPSLLMANLTRIGLLGRQPLGQVERGDADFLAVERVGAVALAGHHADVDGRLVVGVGPEVGHPLQRDLGVARQGDRQTTSRLCSLRAITPRLLESTLTIRVLTSSRTGPVRVKPSCFLEVVERLGDLFLGDLGQVDRLGRLAVGGDLGRQEILDLVEQRFLERVERGPLGDGLVGVVDLGLDVELGDQPVADLGHPGRSADQDDLVELGVALGAGVGQHLVGQLDRPVEQVLGDLLELGPVELDPGLLAGVSDAERGLVALGQRLLAALGLEEQVVEDFGIVERVGSLAGLGLGTARRGTSRSPRPRGRPPAGGRRRCRSRGSAGP